MIKVARCTIVFCIFLAACGEEKVTVYTVPKEEPAQSSQVEAPSPAVGAAWTVPADWKEQPATAMRQGSFLVEGKDGAKVDISVVSFPGDAGGDLANINRWRGQINLPLLDDAALNGAVQNIEIGGAPALLTEMNEKTDGSGRKIVAAILHHDDKTWFFKMTGDASMVDTQKKNFRDFLGSVHFTADKPIMPSIAAAAVQAQPESASPETAKPKWHLPAGWQEQAAGGMRQGSFSITEGSHKVDISLVVLTGDAGGLLANINRWRGQISLPNLAEGDLATVVTKVPTGGGEASVVDMVADTPAPGSKDRSRILAAIIGRGDSSWFLKATGEDTLVEKHKAEFVDFLKSLQLP